MVSFGPIPTTAHFNSLATGPTYQTRMVDEHTYWFGIQGTTAKGNDAGSDGFNYYDRAQIWYALATITGDTTWNTRADSMIVNYIQVYKTAAAASPSGQKWQIPNNFEWYQANGVFTHLARTSSADDLTFFGKQADYACIPYAIDDDGVTTKYGSGLLGYPDWCWSQRVNARGLRMVLFAYLAGASSPGAGADMPAGLRAGVTAWWQRVDFVLDKILGAIPTNTLQRFAKRPASRRGAAGVGHDASVGDDGKFYAWVDQFPVPGVNRLKPWMLGLLANTLIDVFLTYDRLTDARRALIDIKVKSIMDAVWPLFLKVEQCYPYMQAPTNQAELDNGEGTTPYIAGTGFMLAPMMFVALRGQEKGDMVQYDTYKARALAMFNGMNNGNWVYHSPLSGSKTCNEATQPECLRGIAWLAGVPLRTAGY
jgi:hypothetical protein